MISGSILLTFISSPLARILERIFSQFFFDLVISNVFLTTKGKWSFLKVDLSFPFGRVSTKYCILSLNSFLISIRETIS